MTSVTLELTTEEVKRLRLLANQTGAEIGQVLHRLISQLPDVNTKPTSGAQALALWEAEGILGLWKDRADSPQLARELREKAQLRGGSE